MYMKYFVLVLLSIVFFSCNNIRNKKYSYTEKVEEVGLFGGTSVVQKESEEILALSDSVAYIEAFQKFVISQKVYSDMKEAGAKYVARPISFSLYNSKGEDITDIYFESKYTKENEITEWVQSQPNTIKQSADERRMKKNKEQMARRDSAKIKELVKFFNVKKDEFDVDGTTWYKPKDAPKYINQNGIYVYFGVREDGVNALRLRIQYTADEWLFFKKVNFSIDGNPYEYFPNDTETDHGGGSIWEWSDEAIITTSNKELIKALASSKVAKMKFIGRQYYKIKNITPKQVQSINRTIELYRAMGGEF